MKKLFVLSPIVLLSLVACGAPSSSSSQSSSDSPIYLYDADSRAIFLSLDDKGSLPMPTYRNKNTGEVPYVELGDFFYATGGWGNSRTSVKKEGTLYVVYNSDNKKLFSVDPDKDEFTISNYEFWGGNLMKQNNGVGPDICVPSDSDDNGSSVHTSPSSKYLQERKDEVYDAKKWNFDFIEKDGKCYGPAQLLTNTYYRWVGTDLAYNGMDFYFATAITAGAIPAVSQSYYATNRRFAALQGKEAIAYDPQGDEVYRFAYPYQANSLEPVIYHIYSLTKDGKGKLLTGNTPNDKGEHKKVGEITYAYTWEKKGDALLLTIWATGIDTSTEKEDTVNQGIMKIPLRDTFYGSKKRPEAIAKFNYDLLRFQFDNYYGLKEEKGFTDFDKYITEKGLKNDLLSLDADTYDNALVKLLMTNIDDGHTYYACPSVFSGKFSWDGKKMSTDNLGARYTSLMKKQKEYIKLRNKVNNVDENADGSKLQGLFFQGKTAVIRFDAFAGQGEPLMNDFGDPIDKVEPLAAIENGNIPQAFEASFYRIKQHKEVENVVIDLTCNNGGSAKVLPYVTAFFSDDPTLLFKDTAMGVEKEFHYKVDLNHDHVYGGPGDTYKGQYKFFVLTSDFSFSCANFLPAIAKNSGVKLIGKKSGGGGCSVGVFTDACGSIYNTSSSQKCQLKVGDKLQGVDSGVDVDYPLESDSWYDLAKLDTFVSGLANK